MNRRNLILFLLDILVLLAAFIVFIGVKHSSSSYLTPKYLLAFGLLMVSWTVTSFYFRKYNIKRKHSLWKIMQRILYANFVSLGVISIFMFAFQIGGYSRLVFFGTIALVTTWELLVSNLHYLLIHSSSDDKDLLNPPPRPSELKLAQKAQMLQELHHSADAIRNAILEESGEKALEFMEQYFRPDDPKLLLVSTTTRFNVELQPDGFFNTIVNIRRVNDIRYLNKFFESVNRKLPSKGVFIGCAETKTQRKKRVLRKFPPVLNYVFYSFDFLLKRVFPKFILTKKIYFLFTRGENRVLSHAEVLGRLYSCGFAIVEEREVGNLLYFAVEKVKDPAYDFNATYGPFVKLRRIGKGGKIIKVYKLRTMHPYAEYLQDYVYKKNHLDEGGKFKDDFRVSTLGRLFRKLWLDELPMVINILKGEMKLVGVRPLSEHYFSLYSKELQEKRILFKPGLVPPYYADLPKTLEEIEASEMRYLEAYEKSRFKTNWRYFWKAVWNIVFRKARSK